MNPEHLPEQRTLWLIIPVELRALTEFAEEMKMYRQLAERASAKNGQDAGKEQISIVYA